MDDNVVILEPGDERAQKISKAMGSQTANDILKLLAESQKSLTEITERLAIPLTTAKYHIENLLDAGLISVAETRYSVKGREIKIYSLTNQLLIVAPRTSNVRSLLLKYASLFGIVAFGSLVIAILSPILGQGLSAGSSLDGAPRMAAQECAVPAANGVAETFCANVTLTPDMIAAGSKGLSETGVANLTATPVPVATIAPAPVTSSVPIAQGAGASAPAFTPDLALAFFLGGMMVILVLVIYEIYLLKKMK